ncbi:MAG TPA: D-2-hydroxyacid dehydrogenase [Methylomirabilota bacterium]|jgi:phosphoglycerate dehydrogenase-like enzyme|nr:D-2-hydroxyacid dehydrogenase [Methylomirabilota bacterium]
MKVAAGHSFYELVRARVQALAPDLRWAFVDTSGSWSEAPDECDLLVLAGDAYTGALVKQVVNLPQLRWAHTEDAGTDGFFYDTMRARGVTVTHSPGANAVEVAEFALALVLWSAKRLGELHTQQRAHQWRLLRLESLSDKTILVVGLGAIGARVAALAKAFGMRVLGVRSSTARIADVDEQGTLRDLPRFLPEADFVILAVPANAATANLIGRNELALMKPTATLINVARGSVVDLAALREALAQKQIRQACLDVLPQEPWPAEDDLWDTPRVFITPHNAWSSPLYVPRVAELWLENLRRYVKGEELLHKVR